MNLARLPKICSSIDWLVLCLPYDNDSPTFHEGLSYGNNALRLLSAKHLDTPAFPGTVPGAEPALISVVVIRTPKEDRSPSSVD